MACEECSKQRNSINCEKKKMLFQFNNGIKFINRNSWTEIKFTSTWNTRKKKKEKKFFWKFCSLKIMASTLSGVGRGRSGDVSSSNKAPKWRIKTARSAKKSAQPRNVTQFQKSISLRRMTSSPPFFSLGSLKHIPFEPHRLYFILFMKTSGTVDRGGETIEREWEKTQILKTHIWNINLALWKMNWRYLKTDTFNTVGLDWMWWRWAKNSGHGPEVCLLNFSLIVCCWQFSRLDALAFKVFPFFSFFPLRTNYNSLNFSPLSWCVNIIIN